MRNGVSVALHIGDAVYKSDVIQTGANSSAGIGFPDGTALNLSAGTRMALNEYSFEPNASTNAALFTSSRALSPSSPARSPIPAT